MAVWKQGMNVESRRWVPTGSGRSLKKQRQIRTAKDEQQSKFGFELFYEGEKRLGWLLTFASSSLEDQETRGVCSCVDLFFVSQDGSAFKSKYKYSPYFYVAARDKMEMEVEAYLRRRYESQIANISTMEKEDLDLKNHLSGIRKTYLKVSFNTVQQLMDVKKDLLHVIERNQMKFDAVDAYESLLGERREQRPQDFLDCITDLREYDVPYHVRFAIDNDVRCGQWYDVMVSTNGVVLQQRSDLLQRAEVNVCAFDIETTKLPLKFPDAEYDLVMMISYMINGEGYLIINRDCVGEDVEDLEYTPKPEFEGCFKVINVQNEAALIRKWFDHMQKTKPGIYVTYNGDYFDWPFLERRAAHHGYNMGEEIGFSCNEKQGECLAEFACHLDCFAWVKRDSYLPQGSHGLKAVTKAKLGYDPLEVNPEDMVRFSKERPQMMASYSVSDAVATYFLYMTYVHPFIFSLATIIPMPPDEVLRKGSGTLCEMLLMVQAHKANVICPNKHYSEPDKFYKNHLLESETYIGGHVECLQSGVFRSDLPTSFKLDPSAFDKLIENLDRDLQYAVTVEGKMELASISNYDEVKNAISERLLNLRDRPSREECPLIYHLDVAAMYPNIILTNRLQPPSIVTEDICTACDFNHPGKTCLRKLEWVWRGEVFMAKKSDYFHLKKQIESELIDGTNGQLRSFSDLPKMEQQSRLKQRLKNYCQKAYKRVLGKPTMEVREAGFCMRENPFYVDTVRSFRNRRYEYKGLHKVWKGKLSEAKASGSSIKIQEAQDMVVLYDSLQLAHKCILNSFYGYVMRKGARWYSMEMAGVVTYTGAKIIQNACLLVEKIGKPLELDTDGIWCALPSSFPENFTFKTSDMRELSISYPCVMLNVDVARNNTNEQYQTLTDPIQKTYATHRECSIEFEVDGPYKAMILPASKDEGILIKKRYAVFNDDGTLAELKGFEVKRRGELKLIKVFQSELFHKFLHGSTLEECYSCVAAVADRWLDFLASRGNGIADGELIDYISESSTMSRSLVDYGEQKSCALTTAKRLADFLGDAMIKDKGLRCQYIVACEPKGTPVSERAVPVAIFETEEEVMKFFLRKWCRTSSELEIRSIIDWSYYTQRISSAIQKIITIPAAMQKVRNPVPRVVHPDWLHKKVRDMEDKFHQKKLVDIFKPVASVEVANRESMEDMGDFSRKTHSRKIPPRPIVRHFESKPLSLPLQQTVSSTPASIDREMDYQGWLEEKKRRWKQILHARKKQRTSSSGMCKQLGVEEDEGRAQSKAGVGSYYTANEVALTRYHWQIVQIVADSDLGHFWAWVFTEGVMLKVPVTVPRVFFLNSKASLTEEVSGRRVNMTLPHGKCSHDLMEVIMEEDRFRRESRKLDALLADPDVEGLYETNVPLEFNAILKVGCVCQVDKAARKRNLQDGWCLSELQMKTTTECNYMEHPVPFFYLYHSVSEGRGIYVTYLLPQRSLSAVIVGPSHNKDISVSFLERQFREACQTLSVEMPKTGIVVKVDYVADAMDAQKCLQETISELRDEHYGPPLAVVETQNVDSLRLSIPALDSFPCVRIPYNSRDCQYRILGWQQVAAKTGMQRSAAASQWLKERISLSRYAHVPLGNFELDWLIFTMDVFFSRALRDQQQVLWISDNGIPDLGGGTTIHDELSCFVADDVHQAALSYPGAYRRISVELKIHHLAVNALLKSSHVNEMEGSATVPFEQDNSWACYYDETSSCAPALRVFKQLVQRCLADAVASGSVFADALLQHMYRWICSPQSKLHDPALHRVLYKFMQKVFALLLAEFRKLGAIIIFANFSKVIIDTGKLDLSAAENYCQSLVQNLQSRELFEWIELEPVQFWHSLLFMDQHNHGGIPVKADQGDPQVDIISSWNIAGSLPKKIRDYFTLIVSEFIFIPWDYAQKQAAEIQLSSSSSKAENVELQMVENLKAQIQTYFTDKLLGIVRDGLVSFHEGGAGDSGSRHLRQGNPALEFIKHTCAALALDLRVQQEVLVLRRNLLKYVRVREFAPEAEFHDPCPSFVLPGIICSYCNDCRDVDLLADSGELAGGWCCAVPQCGQPYDCDMIENVLVQNVRQRERLYHLQDLSCTRCGHVKAAHLAEQCTCGGSYTCKENLSQFSKKMQVFLDLANLHNFPLLRDSTSWILSV